MIITEFMADPPTVSDEKGEWFELFNTSFEAISLNGWVIQDSFANKHVIREEVVLAPKGVVVFANNPNPRTNGLLRVNYPYQALVLGNDGGEISLLNKEGDLVDKVTYSAALVFPRGSANLDPGAFDAVLNDSEAWYWCRASTATPGGWTGTPGRRNDACALPEFKDDVSPSMHFLTNCPSVVATDESYTYQATVTPQDGLSGSDRLSQYSRLS